MANRIPSLLLSFACCVFAPDNFAPDNPALAQELQTEAVKSDETEMAVRIDALLAEKWTREQATPAPPATDAEFLRRAWLDLCGIIPPINDDDGISGIRDFLKNTNSNKHTLLVEKLLAKPRHAAHFANLWKNALLPRESNLTRFGRDAGFQSWLYDQFRNNVAYDKLVRELLLVSGNANQTGPGLFYTSLELKPEELAASTSRIFLGTQISCAQCHDHPFDHWTRNDFWQYAAFFARLQRGTGNAATFQVVETNSGELKIPETETVARPKFLGGNLSPDEDQTRRERLAHWLTSEENDYFARAAVNRVWAQLFGRGIVDPVDDLGKHNPPSHPELLNELARYFVETGFDLNQLIRTLTATEAYRRSSKSTVESDLMPELFNRMAIKSLTAEQLYDCLGEAVRKRENIQTNQTRSFRQFDQNRNAFLTKFRAPTQGATEYEAGIPQALTLMNGVLIREATDLGRSDLLTALDAPFFNDEKRVNVMFLSTLSRMPTDEERETFVKYVKNRGTNGKRKEALGDILWALLNSAEFVLNH